MPPSARLRSFPDSLPERIRQSLEAAVTAQRDPRSTIEPPRRSDAPVLDETLALLGQLGANTAAIEVHRTLGEGGMGVVRLARQVALDREVAVKGVRASERSRAATFRLLREAWVTGALEHPNVVPVYDVRLDAEGEPQIVLKKIEGSRWSELLADAQTVATRFHAPDLLEWNLRVLMQVASAIHYAHGRGIVHRDLKPENVMIGPFGEVYLLDWGLALALRDDGTGRLPLASEAQDLAGTPYYMAPEMLGGDGLQISERTDVYLLGAVLYEAVIGRPPRDGPNLAAILAQVLDPPAIPDSMPDELRRIVLRAMDPDPDGRFESAEQVRLAITGFLAHRGSILLSDRAHARLVELERAQGDLAGDAEERRLRLYHLFGECRFGFQTALQSWPANESARAGLTRALVRMIELELAGGDPRAAGILLSQIASPDADLVRRVDAARKAHEKEQERKAALARDVDPSIGSRTRSFVGIVMTLLWTVSPLVGWWASIEWPNENADREYPAALGWVLMLIAVAEGLRVWARDSLSRTAVNRNLVTVTRISLVATLVLFLGGWAGGVPFPLAHTFSVVMWGAAAAFAATAVDPRLWPAAGGFAVAFAVAILRPEWAFPATTAANFCLLLASIAAWRHAQKSMAAAPESPVEEKRERWREFLEQERGTASAERIEEERQGGRGRP